MTIGTRIKDRLAALGISQAELARRVGLRQSTINGLIRGEARSSRHLHEIARELETTVAYLKEETEDPEDPSDLRHRLDRRVGSDARRSMIAAMSVQGPVQLVSMKVALPSEAALARMFEGLLRPLDRGMPTAELARTLARRLPIGLSQLQDLVPGPVPAEVSEAGEDPLVPATERHASRRGPRT